MFAPPAKPGPKSAPAKDRARARVVELRRQGLSVYEISSRLRAEATPLNRTGVGQILAEEGFGRLLRGPAPTASTSPATAGRDTRLPRASVIDLAAFPARADTSLAGLLLMIPDLVALDLPALVAATRAALAKHYLDDESLSVSEIAWLLGYREVSSLTHAFKRWTGRTPRQFRALEVAPA